jgi:hypothetical protein
MRRITLLAATFIAIAAAVGATAAPASAATMRPNPIVMIDR